MKQCVTFNISVWSLLIISTKRKTILFNTPFNVFINDVVQEWNASSASSPLILNREVLLAPWRDERPCRWSWTAWRKHFFTMRVVKHWNKLSSKVVDAPCQSVFKRCLDNALNAKLQLWVSPEVGQAVGSDGLRRSLPTQLLCSNSEV